jgi:hypothetical protein
MVELEATDQELKKCNGEYVDTTHKGPRETEKSIFDDKSSRSKDTY